MCATKPIASWPHSPSRISSSAWALAGTRSSPRHGLVPGQQLGPVGVRGDRDRAGVRHGHRDGAQADHAAYVEALDDLAHRAGEGLPADVRLGAAEQQVRRAAGVAQRRTTRRGAS